MKKLRPTPDTCCPLTTNPRLRLTTDAQTDAIKNNFPPGIAKPALRALLAAGYTQLDQLTKISRAELLDLHGMGPTAVATLHPALKSRGLNFRNDPNP